MSENNKLPINETYLEKQKQGLAGFESPRASFSFQTSPGKGIKAVLLIDYNDFSREKPDPKAGFSSKPYAIAIAMTFPEDKEIVYDRIVQKSIAKHGRSKKAELYAAIEMMNQPGGTLAHTDMDILSNPKIKTELEKAPGFQEVYQKLTSGLYSESAVSPSERYSKMLKSFHEDINFPQPEVPKNLDMHESWKRYFQSRKQDSTFSY